jgi:proteasome lid subunit RPN8/RPN11
MLRISSNLLAQVRAHGERAYPLEACGVLAGRAGADCREVHLVVECGNARLDSPRDRYQIAPQELIAAQKQARAAGLEIVGFYHSHPDAKPHWSATDLAEAHWLGCSYVIVSVRQGRAEETASFVLTGTSEEEKKFVGEEILNHEGHKGHEG